MATVTTNMKFSEFLDFLLVRLYELEREQGAGKYFLLNAIAKELKEEVPLPWIRDAAKVLQSRMLANALLLIGGNAQAQLSGEGRLWVEEKKGAVARIESDMRHLVVNVSGSNNQVVVAGGDQNQTTQTLTIEEEREPAFKLLVEIEDRLRKDTTLSPEVREDSLTDLGQVSAQLKKREPNFPALAGLLEPLSQVTSIATRVVELVKLINP